MRSNNKLPQVISDYCLGKKDDIAGSILKDYKDISYQTLWNEAQNNLSNLTGQNVSKFKKELDNLQVKGKAVENLLQQEQDIEQAIIDVEEIADEKKKKTKTWFDSVVKVFSQQEKEANKNKKQEIKVKYGDISYQNYPILCIDGNMYAIKGNNLYEVYHDIHNKKYHFGKKCDEGLLKRQLLDKLRI